MPIQIHNKTYVTVAERVQEAGDKFIGLNTEVLSDNPVVVIKATVTIAHINGSTKTYTGISSANPKKAIEASNPYEVAETSAVGRALGFAGYGIVEGIASADEMVKAQNEATTPTKPTPTPVTIEGRVCPKCGSKLIHTTTGNGKELTKCSTNKWNSELKKAEGCDFVEWGSPKQEEPPLQDIVDF